MKFFRILVSPALFFVACTGSVLIGALPLFMGLVMTIVTPMRPTNIHWTKEDRTKETKEAAFMMVILFIFPFWVTYLWIKTGQIENL